MRFESLADYISAYRADGAVVGLPIPMVAEHFGVTSAAVTGRIRSGSLDGLSIGTRSFVSLASVVAEEDKMAADVRATAAFLWGQARKAVPSMFYEPVMAKVGLTSKVPNARKRIGVILARVSRQSAQEAKVMLPVLVHKKAAGVTRPGPGFFDLARELGFKFDDEDEFVKAQTAMVLKLAKKRT